MTAFIDRPTHGYDAAERFWLWVTGTSLSARRGPTDQFATLLPRAGDAYLRVQRVDDGPGGSHLDLHVDDVAATAARAAGLGALEVDSSEGLAVMRSPSGLPWCVVRHHGEAVAPAPVVLDDGTVVRVDQLCVDVPHDRFEEEVAFWSALTGWEPRPVHPTFTFLFGPRGLALHLLLQRREDAGGRRALTSTSPPTTVRRPCGPTWPRARRSSPCTRSGRSCWIRRGPSTA